MKLSILSCIILFGLTINSGQAQLLNFLHKGKNKDSHYNYSSYTPKKETAKERKETRKKINAQLAKSYRPSKKKSAMSREEQKEIKNSKKRLQRSKGATQEQAKKQDKKTNKTSQRYLTKTDKKRAKKIAYSKKNYGTKATRKASQTHQSERNIIDNDEGKKSLFKFRRNA